MIERHDQPFGYVPIATKDRREGSAALGRLGGQVADVMERAGVEEDELVREITGRCRSR